MKPKPLAKFQETKISSNCAISGHPLKACYTTIKASGWMGAGKNNPR
jgi:hypothetical protein